MCECLDYEDGDRYQCVVCADRGRDFEVEVARLRAESDARDIVIQELAARLIQCDVACVEEAVKMLVDMVSEDKRPDCHVLAACRLLLGDARKEF